MKYIWILVAFLASYLLSLLLNLRYGFLEPIQAMVWMTFQYFILFLKDPARPCEKSQREFRVISWIFCVYQFCCSAASLVLLFFEPARAAAAAGASALGALAVCGAVQAASWLLLRRICVK